MEPPVSTLGLLWPAAGFFHENRTAVLDNAEGQGSHAYRNFHFPSKVDSHPPLDPLGGQLWDSWMSSSGGSSESFQTLPLCSPCLGSMFQQWVPKHWASGAVLGEHLCHTTLDQQLLPLFCAYIVIHAPAPWLRTPSQRLQAESLSAATLKETRALVPLLHSLFCLHHSLFFFQWTCRTLNKPSCFQLDFPIMEYLTLRFLYIPKQVTSAEGTDRWVLPLASVPWLTRAQRAPPSQCSYCFELFPMIH